MQAIPAKPCYSHIGGRLGSLLMEQFITNGWIKPSAIKERMYHVTPKGKKAFKEMGVDLSLIPEEEL